MMAKHQYVLEQHWEKQLLIRKNKAQKDVRAGAYPGVRRVDSFFIVCSDHARLVGMTRMHRLLL